MKLFPKTLFLICAIIGNLNAQEWQNYTMPNDTTIFHKMCKVDNSYWAIDYGNGQIFNSQDHGENWELQFETPGEFLERIQFVDKNTGYLCGDYGIIMKTTDGGNSWKDIGPKYAPRITKTDPMERDSAALKRYFYEMYFKDKERGLLWGFEIKPLIGWRASQKRFFYKTLDGGKSWERIDYKREEHDGIVASFLEGVELQEDVAMGIYYAPKSLHKIGWQGMEVSNDKGQNWENFPYPQFSDDRVMLRTTHFISEHQGYILGGNLEKESQGYIIETLDGGRTWRVLENELPHIHYSLQNGNEFLVAGKDKMLKKWRPAAKADSSFIHKGDAAKILIDGMVKKREWQGANKTMIKAGVDLFTLQDDHFLYLSIQYDTALYTNYCGDLYFELAKDSLLHIHASQQLGERILKGAAWTDSSPAFRWGYIADWTANQIKFDPKDKVYLPYQALEFQIAKSKLPEGRLKIALESRDLNGEKEVIRFPEGGDLKSTKDWLLLYLD